jgi:predicted secreted protein
MKYLSIIIILIATACGSSKTSNNPTDKNIIHLKMNEEKTIELPGRASSGHQMAFTLSDTSVAKVTRKEIVSTYDSTALRPGDPALTIWVIKGLKPGTTRMKFAGPRIEKRDAANLRFKNLKIVVTD